MKGQQIAIGIPDSSQRNYNKNIRKVVNGHLFKNHVEYAPATMNFTLVFNQIVVLFIYIATGFISKKLNILDHHTTGKLSKLIINITIPVLIISTMEKNSGVSKNNILIILLISLVFYICMYILALFIPKFFNIPSTNKGIHQFMLMFSNTGFMGLPVINAIWGSEGVFNAIIFNLPYFTLVFTLGVSMITGKKNERVQLKTFLTPPIIANIIGLMIFILSIDAPEIVALSFAKIGSLTTPLALMIIGASLANVKINAMLTNHIHFLYSTYKLLIVPFMVFTVLNFLNLSGSALGTIVVLSGMPMASNGVIIAKQYGLDETFPSEGVFISTMLSFFTIPFIAYFLSQVL